MMFRLVDVAAQMRTSVLDPRRTNWAVRKLQRGLWIVLEVKDGGQWRLAIGRDTIGPSETEVEILRNAFAVPAGTDEVRRWCAVTGAGVTMYIVEWKWIEVEAIS